MSNKYTIEEIYQMIDEKFNGKVKLLSTEYVGSQEKLLFQCECGNTFNRIFKNVYRREEILCQECRYKRVSQNNRKSLDDVLNDFKQLECEYISGEYETIETKLLFKCTCGNLFNASYADVIHFGRTKCHECAKAIGDAKKRKTFNQVLDEIEAGGCEYIGGIYQNVNSLLTLRCPCGNIFQRSLHCYNNHGNQCPECGSKKMSDCHKKLIFELDEEMKVYQYFRRKLSKWVLNIKDIYNNKCAVSNEEENLAVHHLNAFSMILNKVVKKYADNITDTSSITIIKDQETLDAIEKDLLEEHTNQSGILISSEIHNRFHSIYGKGNNTAEQFDEFLRHFYNTSLSEVMVA